MNELYINIRSLRIKKGLSQQDLAEMVGYTSRTSIAKIESGKVDLSFSKILQFAEALGITPTYLIGGCNDEK